jgi:predicted enzyme related to lactoylglutathione lyase
MGGIIVWADIPVTDMQRAMRFYQHVTGDPVTLMPGTNDTVALIGAPVGEGRSLVSIGLQQPADRD